MKVHEILTEARSEFNQKVIDAVNMSFANTEDITLTDEQLQKYLAFRRGTLQRMRTRPSDMPGTFGAMISPYEKQTLSLQTAVWLQKETGKSEPRTVHALVNYPWRKYKPTFIDHLKHEVKFKFWSLEYSPERAADITKELNRVFGPGNAKVVPTENNALVVKVKRPEETQKTRQQSIDFKTKAKQIIAKVVPKFSSISVTWAGKSKTHYGGNFVVWVSSGEGEQLEPQIRQAIQREMPEARITTNTNFVAWRDSDVIKVKIRVPQPAVNEALDPRALTTNLDALKKDKTSNSKAWIKILRSKADRHNPVKSKTSKLGSWDPFGGMTGYPSFKSWNVDQKVYGPSGR